MVALTGPGAGCTAGPDGGPGSDFRATQTPASGTVDIENGGGNSLIGGARQISGGNVLGGLAPGGMLGMVLGAIPANAVSLKYTPGSTAGAGSGPQSRAAAGELMLGVGGMSAVSLVGGSVSCGANQAAPGQTSTSSSPAIPPATSAPGSGSLPGGGSGTSSSEHSLSGIQSDEGRYVPASDDTPLWAGLAAGGAALAGGLALWRRRRSARA